VLEAIKEKESFALCTECSTSSKLADYKMLRRNMEIKIPPYHETACPWFLEPGRRLKTQLRLGTHMLQIDQGRRFNIPSHQRFCPLCAEDIEDAFHFTMECASLASIREDFLAIVDEIIRPDDVFGWARMDKRSRWEFMLGDGLLASDPKFPYWLRIEHKVYAYLMKAKRARSAILS
jgi:hypothetical protein